MFEFHKHVSFILIAILMLTASAQNLTDNDIKLAIKADMLFDEMVDSDDIDIRVDNGIVTLSGQAESLLEYERAIDIAQGIKGVRSVVNNIALEVEFVSDEELEKRVRNSLIANPATDQFNIDIFVDDGVVRLLGQTDSWAEKEIATNVVRNIAGVVAVKNDLTFMPEENRPDSDIKADIINKLDYDIFIEPEYIDIAVNDGIVTMTGTLGSRAEKDRAEKNAYVAGVKKVDTEGIKVEHALDIEAMKNTKKVATRDMKDVEDALETAIRYDPRVYPHDIDVEVREYTATLEGKVNSVQAAMAAEEDAINTLGVYAVENNIEIVPETNIDENQIKKYTQNAILWNPELEISDVNIIVNDNTVELHGRVEHRNHKKIANDIASNIVGVKEVVNNIQIEQNWEPKADSEIKDDIKADMFWNINLNASQIEVEVDEGIVHLDGCVESKTELSEAIKSAYEGGAKEVYSDITIDNCPIDYNPAAWDYRGIIYY
ncbi:MAG: BON domain-containing protein [Candidatus Zixiibacteriota bacterium]